MDSALEKKLRMLVDVFLIENAKLNLSAFRTPESCWTGNILDSLAVVGNSPLPQAGEGLGVRAGNKSSTSVVSILDLGTGGGFPLLPLAVSLPSARFTGMDATLKKIDAVGRIVEQMALKNVELICGRAEALGRVARHREQYDLVLCRAVAQIAVNLEYCSPFVRPGGRIILWKSMDVEEELKTSGHAQKELRCRLTAAHVYELPGDFGKRQLLIFEKAGKLPDMYPRAVGVAKKKPL